MQQIVGIVFKIGEQWCYSKHLQAQEYAPNQQDLSYVASFFLIIDRTAYCLYCIQYGRSFKHDVGNSLLAKPNSELVSREPALLGDLQSTTIACHVQSMTHLLDPGLNAPTPSPQAPPNRSVGQGPVSAQKKKPELAEITLQGYLNCKKQYPEMSNYLPHFAEVQHRHKLVAE